LNTQKIIEEKGRRKLLFNTLSHTHIASNIEPSTLRELKLYGGAAGVWVNLSQTENIVFKSYGVAVSIRHTGKHYNDEISQSGINYDFPSTNRKGSHDKNEIEAIRACHVSRIPLFVICNSSNSKLRDVYIGIVSGIDDDMKKASIEFTSLDAFEQYPDAISESSANYQSRFNKQVEKALSDSSEARKERLEHTNKRPTKTYRKVVDYIRNPDVVAEVLFRAKGICELCDTPAPFMRKSDGSAYLEVHHIIQLSKGGDDTVDNAMALCPNCHREEHFGGKE